MYEINTPSDHYIPKHFVTDHYAMTLERAVDLFAQLGLSDTTLQKIKLTLLEGELYCPVSEAEMVQTGSAVLTPEEQWLCDRATD